MKFDKEGNQILDDNNNPIPIWRGKVTNARTSCTGDCYFSGCQVRTRTSESNFVLSSFQPNATSTKSTCQDYAETYVPKNLTDFMTSPYLNKDNKLVEKVCESTVRSGPAAGTCARWKEVCLNYTSTGLLTKTSTSSTCPTFTPL